MEQHRSKHDRQIIIVPKENDQDQILKRKSEKNINVESFVNEKEKKEIIIKKIESNNKEVERKEKERKYIYEEVKKNKSCKIKEEERKKVETVEKKVLFENMEEKINKSERERKEKRKRYFFNHLLINAG